MADTTQTGLRPMTYRELSDWHNELTQSKPEVFGSMSLSNFSQALNHATGQPIANMGLHDSWVKRASTGLDRGLEATGIPDALKSAGGAIGETMGYREAGERAGHGFLRGLVNFAPLITAEVLSGGAATPLMAAGYLGTGGLSAADTYAETDSPLASLISGVGAAAAPVAGRYGGEAALKAFGAPVFTEAMKQTATRIPMQYAAAGAEKLLPGVGERFAQGTGQRVAQFLGANLGMVAEGEVAGESSSVAAGNGLYNPLNPEHIFETALSLGPYAALGIPGLRRSSAAEYVNKFMQTSAAARKAEYAAGVNRDVGSWSTTDQTGLSAQYSDNRFDIRQGMERGLDPYVQAVRDTAEETINRGVTELSPLFGLDGDQWQARAQELGDELAKLEHAERAARGEVPPIVDPLSPRPPAPGATVEQRTIPPVDRSGRTGTLPRVEGRGGEPTNTGETLSTPTPEYTDVNGVKVPARSVTSGVPLTGDHRPFGRREQRKLERSQGVENRRKADRRQGRADIEQGLADYYDEGLDNRPESESSSNFEEVPEDHQVDLPPISDAVMGWLAQHVASLEDKAPTGEIRSHVADTITLRHTLNERFGTSFPTLSDAGLVYEMQKFAKDNPTHPDPVKGFAEAFRAKTLRQANDDNTLRHIGQSIGTDEATMNRGLALLDETHKQQDAERRASGELDKPTDAETVARLVEETQGAGKFVKNEKTGKMERVARQGSLSNSLGGPEAIYRAYDSFRALQGDKPYTQEELAGYLSETARKARMKGEVKLTARGQTSLDFQNEESGGSAHGTVAASEGFGQLDPGLEAASKVGKDKIDREVELTKEDDPASHDVAAVYSEITLVSALSKLSWLVKMRPDIWKTIWAGGKSKAGLVRTRIFMNIAFEKMRTQSGTIGPAELNKAFAAYDAAHGTKVAYYRTNEKTGESEVSNHIPNAQYEKLHKVFQLVQGLPDFGVEGAMGNKDFLRSVDLLNNPQGTERAGLITAGEFYSRLFREKMGYAEPIARAMTEQMQKIVAAFGSVIDRIRVTGLADGVDQLGAYIKSFGNPLWTGIVGIAEKSFGATNKNFVMHQLVLSHELTHGVWNQYTLMRDTGAQTMPKAMFDAIQKMDEISGQLTADQRSQMLGEIRDMILPKFKGKEFDQILSNSAADPNEFSATVGALLTMNHVGEDMPSSRSLRQLFMEAPKEFADMMKHTIRYVADMARALWSSFRGDELLRMNLGLNTETKTQLSKAAKQYVELFQSVLQDQDKINKAVSDVQRLEQLSPTMYSTLVSANRVEPIRPAEFEGAPGFAVDAMKKVKEELGIDQDNPIKPTFLQRKLEQFTQLAERYPILRVMSNIAYNADHRTKQNIAKLMSIFAMDVDPKTGVGKMDPKMTTTQSVTTNVAARDAFSEIARLQRDINELQRTAVGTIARTEPRVQAILRKFPPAFADRIWTTFEKANVANIMVGNERVASLRETNGLIVAKLIQSMEPTRPAQATEQIGQQIMMALANNDISGLMSAMAGMTPETYDKVAKLASGLHEGWDKITKQTLAQPWYFTERRYGEYTVTWKKKDGTTGRAQKPTQEMIDAVIADQVKQGSEILTRLTPDDMRKPMSQYSDAYKQAVLDAQDKSVAMLRSILANDPETLAQIEPLMQIEADASAEMQANDVRKMNPYRKFASGREYIDMFDASMISNTATLRGLTRRWLRAKAALYTSDPELAKQPALQRLAQDHVDNMLTPDAPLGQALTRANFYYYIVGNLANMMQEPFQQFGTVIPALQREGAGFFQSNRLLLEANRKIAKFWQGKSTGSAEHDAVMTRFNNERENPHGFLSEFDSEGLAAMNALRASDGSKLMTTLEAVSKPIVHLVSFAKNAYLKVPEHNARVTMLAAYDLARSKGMTPEAAYNEATRIYRYSNFAGGKAGRAVGVYSGRDPFTKSAAQVMMSLQTYQTGYISMMSRLLSEGFGKGKLQGPEGPAARKAAITMLGVQFILAGALGMPFAGQSVALLQQLFPGLELEKNIRDGLGSLMGDDQAMGGFVTNSVTHGVLGELGGIDLSSRFGLGNMFGMSSFGYDPTNMIGPTGGMVRNMVLGIKDASVGDIGSAAQHIVPPALKHVVEAYREDDQFKDKEGNLLFEGTPTEKAFRLLGYTPSRERDIREQQRIMTRSQQVANMGLNKFYSDLADKVADGDYSSVRDALLQKQREDYTFDARAGLRQVAKVAEQRTNPVDMRNQGSAKTADDRMKLMSTYAAQGGTTEEQRLIQRSNLERMIGINGAGHISPTELHIARLTDQLTQTYPNLTIDQVRALARQTMVHHMQSQAHRMTPEQRDQMIPGGM